MWYIRSGCRSQLERNVHHQHSVRRALHGGGGRCVCVCAAELCLRARARAAHPSLCEGRFRPLGEDRSCEAKAERAGHITEEVDVHDLTP